ncbi:hypothetical protein ACFXPX_34430 [Kitasatospora sp. NPDC059146]|uniref:hypothetical protein n=1 Tax=unclassified Kitasatospora TaxID=2633591 RepID=UPI0036828255
MAVVAVLGGGVAIAINAWMDRGPETRVSQGPVAGYPLLVSSDGLTLTLNIGWGCEERPELVAHESTGTVTVSLRHTVRPGFCDPGGAAQITTRLSEPLGTRTLDDATGKPAVHFDERKLLRPAFLPENYYPAPAGRMVYLPGLAAVPTDTPAWAVRYTLGTEPDTQGSLIIGQTLRSSTPPPGKAATVKGLPASITHADSPGGPHSLTWSDGTYTFVVTTGGPPRLTDEELVRVAEGLG